MSSQRSACHHRGAFPSPGPMSMMALGTVGSRVACSVGVGRAVPARILPGLLRLPRQGSCRGNLLRPSALCDLGLGVALIILGFGLTLAHLPSSAWCDRGRGSDCPCTGKGVQRCAPLFVHRQQRGAPPRSGGQHEWQPSRPHPRVRPRFASPPPNAP